jgi:hypothetical protein
MHDVRDVVYMTEKLSETKEQEIQRLIEKWFNKGWKGNSMEAVVEIAISEIYLKGFAAGQQDMINKHTGELHNPNNPIRCKACINEGRAAALAEVRRIVYEATNDHIPLVALKVINNKLAELERGKK